MATAARSVSCPHCGHVRTTKANRGVVLVCPNLECARSYRCPPVDEVSPAPRRSPAAGDGGEVPADLAPTDRPDLPRARPVVTQVARPRERGSSPDPGQSPTPTPDPGAVAVLEQPAKVANPTGRTGDPDVLREAGRRGGLASYARQRRGL